MLAKKITKERPVFNDLLVIKSGGAELVAELSIPEIADGMVVFCHGARNRRHGAANSAVAGALKENGFGTAVCNLLTPAEETADEHTAGPRFDVKTLAG